MTRLLTLLFFLLLSCFPASAAPVNSETATRAVRGWLRQDHHPLGQSLPGTVKSTEAVINAAGETVYYVVHLAPSGYAIVPADDLVEPIIAFSAQGHFDSRSSGDPAVALVNGDLPRRLARVRAGLPDARAIRAGKKWQSVLLGSPASGSSPDAPDNGHVVIASQIWVAPFLQTLWSQQTDVSLNFACYNYFTPPGNAGDPNNYPCGCVATSLAQEMNYFQYPTTGVGTSSFSITVDGSATTASLRGGNGSGGPYQWTAMPAAPDAPTTAQAQAVGSVCYDAGLAVNMSYSASGSSAEFALIQSALTKAFKYSNAGYYEDDSNGLGGTNLLNMINPSVDARLPVFLGIEPDGGHCLLVDGYGYTSSTLYHHVNPGWAGDDDIWYALPEMDTDNGDFTSVVSCIYDVYTSGSGEIISGHVTDPAGAAVSGATVTAVRSGGGTYTATTDSNGVYALARIPSASHYTLTVTNAGYAAASASYSTGTSRYEESPSGNTWGANFTLSPPLLAIPETGFASIGPVGGPFSVTSQTCTLTNTSAAAVNWTLANTASWLSATSSSGALAARAAASLTISLNSAANSLPAGTNNATIWITNLNNHLAQSLAFSLTAKTADYPIAVSGFNQDVVVENDAVGGNTLLYATAFDPGNELFGSPGSPFCFYEAGLVATNFQGGTAAEGLPQGGLFTSLMDNRTTFQFGPYDGSNVLYLTSSQTTGSLTLITPAAYISLSVLAASAEGGGNGWLVLHFADNSASSSITFDAADYFATNSTPPATAITQFGIEEIGTYNEFYVFEDPFYYPNLYQTSINLQSLGLNTKTISSVTFTMPAGINAAAVTGVFALSGTESPFPPVITSQPQSVVTTAGGNATFSVGVTGEGALGYQWLLNGSTLSGAQSSLLSITHAGLANAGSYQVIVTNTSGSVTSQVAVLSLTNFPVSFVTGPAGPRYSGGDFTLQLTNLAGQGAVVIAASTNLWQWVPVFTNPSGFGAFIYTDSAASAFPHRFYRATTP